ncbi:hypothetical protein pdam_00010009 [Pocillopora damicornis]|uniref:Uncharacterized protein n=1 Tax=Pocillopora damicornis TaxID=46731 RepID=A0A3M6T4Y3_POCDA|nr:hypothetical protein pdam_00010009 [Pocillopora damicornis]
MECIPSKMTESVICDSIDDHLDKVIQRNQWGFRKVMLISRKSFTGPLKPVKWGNKCLEYTDKLKSLKRISYLSTKELESIYFKLIIPHINYCISVWRNCSTSASETIEALHVKAARLIHRLPSSLEDHDVTKKRLALEMFQIMNSDGCLRLSHMFKQVNSLRKGKLIEMKTTTSEFGRQSFLRDWLKLCLCNVSPGLVGIFSGRDFLGSSYGLDVRLPQQSLSSEVQLPGIIWTET